MAGFTEDRWFVRIRNPDGTYRKERSPRHGEPMRYRARYTAPDGKERSKSFPDGKKREADAYVKAMSTDVTRGAWTDPAGGRRTLRRYAEDTWYPSQGQSIGARRNLRGYLDNHILPALGDRALGDLAAHPSMIQRWVTGLSVAPVTAGNILGTLSAILSAAVDDNLIPRNPCKLKTVRRPEVPVRLIVPWQAGRVAAVRGRLAERYRAMADCGAGLGLRQGEVIGLAPGDLDRKTGIVHVTRQVRRAGGTLCFAPPKGNKTRDVPLPRSVADAIAAHLDGFPAASVTLPWSVPGGEPVTVPLVFTSGKGTVVRATNFDKRTWLPALRAAGVPAVRENGFHALRHYFASVLLHGGCDIVALSRYLGHGDPGFTLRIYCHLMPGAGDMMRRIIDAAGQMPDPDQLAGQLEEFLSEQPGRGSDGLATD